LMLVAGSIRRIDPLEGSDVFYDFKMVIDGFTTEFVPSSTWWTATEFVDDLAYILTLSLHIGYVGGIVYEKNNSHFRPLRRRQPMIYITTYPLTQRINP